MAGRVVGTGFDGRPGWNPQRTYAAGLVQYFRDVSTFHGNSYTERIIFNLDGVAILKTNWLHKVLSGPPLVTIWAARASNSGRRAGAFRLRRRACGRES